MFSDSKHDPPFGILICGFTAYRAGFGNPRQGMGLLNALEPGHGGMAAKDGPRLAEGARSGRGSSPLPLHISPETGLERRRLSSESGVKLVDRASLPDGFRRSPGSQLKRL